MSNRAWVIAVAFGLILTGLPYSFGETEGPVGQPDDSQDQATEQAAVEPGTFADVPPAIPTSPEHDQGSAPNSGTDAQEQSNLLMGDGLAQWVMAVTGVGALVLSGWAVWLLKQTLSATRQTLTEAEKARDLARDTVTATREIGQAQVRAYLTIHIHDVVIKAGGPFVAKVTVKNYGASPAVSVTIRSYCYQILTDVDDMHPRPSEDHLKVAQVGSHIGSQQDIYINIQTSSFHPFSEKDLNDIRREVLAVRGTALVTYKDVFGRPCWTRQDFEFCGEHSMTTGHVKSRIVGQNSDCG